MPQKNIPAEAGKHHSVHVQGGDVFRRQAVGNGHEGFVGHEDAEGGQDYGPREVQLKQRHVRVSPFLVYFNIQKMQPKYLSPNASLTWPRRVQAWGSPLSMFAHFPNGLNEGFNFEFSFRGPSGREANSKMALAAQGSVFFILWTIFF